MVSTDAGHELTRVVADLRRLYREQLELSYVRRADGVERVGETLSRLGEVSSSAGIVARAPEALGRTAHFDRVLLSRVDGERLRVLVAWPAGGLDDVVGDTLELAYPLIEAEVAQRRGAALVTVAESGRRAAPGLAARLGWERYVVAALELEGRTVGLLHADRLPRGAAADALDLELTVRFADGLAQVLERALLGEQVRRRGEHLQSAARWIADQQLRLSSEETPTPHRGPGDDRELTALLTPRELEILRLVARGLSNRAIATSLTLAEGTVKYHVKNILRKLQASSRTQAVSRSMRLGDGLL